MSLHPRDQAILDAGRPHGCNPAVFNGPCDCDACQEYDTIAAHARRMDRIERECAELIKALRAARFPVDEFLREMSRP